jgi:hypothetical protein
LILPLALNDNGRGLFYSLNPTIFAKWWLAISFGEGPLHLAMKRNRRDPGDQSLPSHTILLMKSNMVQAAIESTSRRHASYDQMSTFWIEKAFATEWASIPNFPWSRPK